MRKILFVAVVCLLVTLAGEKANAFEISNVVVDGNQVILQTTYGGSISLERRQSAVPIIIELYTSGHCASIRNFLDKKTKTIVRFSKSDDFHAFSSFLKKTSDEVGVCFSDEKCTVHVFF